MIEAALQKITAGKDLNADECQKMFESILSRQCSEAGIAAALTALKMKGESATEIAGTLRALNKHSKQIKLRVGGNLLDVCGTGGDKLSTFNISTVVMFVAAAAGCTVVKHGNRAVTSKCGSADVLEQLGIKTNLSAEQSTKIIEKHKIGFLFAPLYHPLLKNLAKIRKALPFRTILNIAAPLANPANANCRLIGTFDLETGEKVSRVFASFGIDKALVVNGYPSMDEISTIGTTSVFEVTGNKIDHYKIHPEEFGIKKAKLSQLKGGNAEKNAKTILRILQGKKGPQADIVVLNSAAAIYAAKRCNSVKDGIEIAKNAIDSRAAYKKLEEFRRATNEFP